jgi:tRNA modification GTPase
MDSIVALATPPGVSGLAVIRISGEDAIDIASKHYLGKANLLEVASHTIHYGKFANNNQTIDTVTFNIFRSPNSYTGENVVEISCHGGIIIYKEIIKAIINSGARQAKAGEFTQRAFLNRKMDLLQAEAVADLIHSVSVISEQVSARQLQGSITKKIKEFKTELIEIAGLLELELDFSEEEIEFITLPQVSENIQQLLNYINSIINSYSSSVILQNGYSVAIIGFPNSGKSTLFNKLLSKDRAIVSEIAGTTRDYLEEFIYLNNIPIKIIDTAGMRDTTDIIEIEGIKLVNSVIEQSNLIMVLNDASISNQNSDNLITTLKEDYPKHEILILQNKIDKIEIERKVETIGSREDEQLFISAKTNYNIPQLLDLIEQKATNSISRINDLMVNERQLQLMEQISSDLLNAIESVEMQNTNELIAVDIRAAIRKLGELTGDIYNQEILNQVFSKFCIGK